MSEIEPHAFVEDTSLEVRGNLPAVMLELEADARPLREPEPLRPIQEDELQRRRTVARRLDDLVAVLVRRDDPDIVVARDFLNCVPADARLRGAIGATGICRHEDAHSLVR